MLSIVLFAVVSFLSLLVGSEKELTAKSYNYL